MKRILIIDDSPLVIEAVREALAPDGILVDELSDAAELERVQLDDFALILCDVHLPAIFGEDVAGTMRRRTRTSAPIVLLSSLPEAELAARARASGLDGYILKERGVDVLVDEVRAWLEGRRQRLAARTSRATTPIPLSLQPGPGY
ncbi:MAG TPA: response regulator [Kofleriaceae bacterium]|nr:response regulator [Kofleriaceae bacterium]